MLRLDQIFLLRPSFRIGAFAATWLIVASAAFAATPGAPIVPPVPEPAKRPTATATTQARAVRAMTERLALVNAVHSWGYQLEGASVPALATAPHDLLVLDATTGLAEGRPFKRAEVDGLKKKPDGSRRVVVSYLSVGEAEDYRTEYFAKEYMTEDAPDWLMAENKDWAGNRIINVCSEGWQRTILGDDTGRSVYNSVEPSPLQRLIDLGFDGVYLDRVDVYEEVLKLCPDAEARMVDFVVRLAAAARKRDPHFLVIMQNAEELLKHPQLTSAIDAMAKESLIHGWGGGDASNGHADTSDADVRDSVALLDIARQAGRPVFVVDYPIDTARAADSLRRIRGFGYVPYIAGRHLDHLNWPGRDY